jgi:hypothetical protein
MTPNQIKRDIISLLEPYVKDKSFLSERAIDLFSVEAVSIGRLLSRAEWKSLFDFAFALRHEALVTNKTRATEVMASFQVPIQETQGKFALQVTFEQDKEKLNIEEYAFELFRNIGALIESTVQPFLKEFYCLAQVCKGFSTSPATVIVDDFGNIVAELEKLISLPDLVAPSPWHLRLNQWRNIAQHHKYKVEGDIIIAEYGKSPAAKNIRLTRNELTAVAIEVNARLGILKSSRFLTVVNNIDHLRPFLATIEDDVSAICLNLASGFVTQGFRVTGIDYAEDPVTVRLIDDAPHAGPKRYIHCSQFLLPIATHFPGRAVEVQLRTSDDRPQWVFRLEAERLMRIVSAKEPDLALAETIDWKNVVKIAKENGVESF